MIVLRFSMQGEDIIEHTNGKFHVFMFEHEEEEFREHRLMSSVMCVDF